MAQRVEVLSITVPVGTTQASPQETDLPFRQGFIDRIELRIPPGPSGLVGVRILHSGRVVIPYERDDWLITDDEIVSWPLEDYPTGEAWSVQLYNDGVYPHTIQVRLLYNEIGRQRLAVVAKLDVQTPAPSVGVSLEGVDA